MILTKQEQAALLAGQFPEIIRNPSTWRGQVVIVSQSSLSGPVAQFSITITGWKRGAKGEYMAEYSVRDDRPLYMRRGAGHTRSAGQSIDPEADIIDPETLERFATENSQKSAVLAAEQQRRDKVHRLELKREEAIERDEQDRIKKLTTRIERYRLDAA